MEASIPDDTCVQRVYSMYGEIEAETTMYGWMEVEIELHFAETPDSDSKPPRLV
jgi:hypothetical protein